MEGPEPLYTVKGSWVKSVTFIPSKSFCSSNPEEGIRESSVQLVNRILPQRALPVPNALPTDSRFREDLIWLARKDEKNASIWKEYIEIQQRWDRKMR